MKLYKEQQDQFGFVAIRAADTGDSRHHTTVQIHHPMGRMGKYLLCWVWITRERHELIHLFGKQSRSIHWLLKPYDGKPYDPMEPRAWPAWAEAHWPEEFRRP